MKLILPTLLGRRLTILSCLAVLSFSGGRAATRSPISLDVLQRDGYGSVELVKDGQNKLYVPTEINGRKIRLLLDTGWGTEGITVRINPSELHVVLDKGVEMARTVSGAPTSPFGLGAPAPI